MPPSVLRKRLQDICERALAETQKGTFLKIVQNELLPLVENSEVLHEAWTMRLHYYDRLVENPDYQSFIALFHKNLARLQKAITREPLTKVDNRLANRMRPGVAQDPDNISLPELYDALSRPEQWWRLGEDTGAYEIGDSFQTRWKPVLGQYQALHTFIEYAQYRKALEPSDKAYALADAVIADVERLRVFLEQPFHRFHMVDFEWIDHIAKFPKWCLGDTETMKAHLRVVYTDLALCLEEHDEQTGRSGGKGKKKAVQYLGGERLKYGDEEKIMPKGKLWARLSQQVYELCRAVGTSIPVEKLYCELTGRDYRVNRETNWKWLSDTVWTANKWAKRNGLPKLFRCTKREVVRLGT